MAFLVDAHAHLDSEQFAGDCDAVIERAREAGVGAIVTAGVDVASSQAAIALAERFSNVYAAVGVHPNETALAAPQDLATLRSLAAHPKVVAIGEIGLDFYWDRAPHDAQRQWFDDQLDLATELDLPTVIHARNSLPDVLRQLRRWVARGASPQRGMMHCFSGDVAEAAEAIELGMYISLAGPITFPKNARLGAVAREMPLDRLLTETDCPYLAPQSVRGRRNEPAFVVDVASKIAEIKGLDRLTVVATTGAAAQRLFRIAQ